MTQKEAEQYEKIRANPKYPVFDMLFTQNPDGSIHPKPGVIFKLMGGIPYVEDISPLGNLFSSQFALSNPISPESIALKGKTFQDISNEIALKSPFGKNSIFYIDQICGEFTNTFYSGGIDYELLAQDLFRYPMEINPPMFDYTKYEVPDKEISVVTPFVGESHKKVNNNKPFTFKNENNETTSAVFESGKLNHRKCYLRGDYHFNIELDSNYSVSYSLYFPYKDAKITTGGTPNGIESLSIAVANDEQYAIILKTTHISTFLEFIKRIKGLAFFKNMKKNISAYYAYFFSQAKNDADKLDGLYEYIPDFVLEKRNDLELWNDLAVLSESSIDTWGTNENISILNLLKGIKNKNWWYQQINQNPEVVRNLFKEFSTDYIENLIMSFSSVGLDVWTNKELDGAWTFHPDYEELNSKVYKQSQDSSTPDIRYTGFAYYLADKKQYKIGTAIFAYEPGSLMPDKSKEIGPKELFPPFTPLKMLVGKEVVYIPAFAAEYFTNKKINEELWTVLNNIVDALLPEFNLMKSRSLFTLSKITQGKTIRTETELIEFLDKIDQNVMATDLEKVGIKALFRGTTRSAQGELFAGNLNTIENGTSTSTDPIRAVIFGIESSSKPGAGKGMLQIYPPKDLKGLNLVSPNRRVDIELEVIIGTNPQNLSNFTVKEISIEEARLLVKKLYGIELDTRMDINVSRYWLKETEKLLPKEAIKFYTEAMKVKTKK